MDSWDALRRNLTALIDAARDGLRSGPSGVLQLEAETDIGKSTLYRILDAREKNPTQLDTLEKLASAYNLQVWQLLVPRLDPTDPPEYVGSRQMSVLRSVFAQTHTQATHEPQPDQQHNEGAGAAGKGTRRPRNRVRAGGPPAAEPPHATKRQRRTKS